VAYSLSKQLVGRCFPRSKDLNPARQVRRPRHPRPGLLQLQGQLPRALHGIGDVDVTAMSSTPSSRRDARDDGPGPRPAHQFFVLKPHLSLPVGAWPILPRELRSLVHGESTNQGIKARNKEQRFAWSCCLTTRSRGDPCGPAGQPARRCGHRRGARESHGAEGLTRACSSRGPSSRGQ